MSEFYEQQEELRRLINAANIQKMKQATSPESTSLPAIGQPAPTTSLDLGELSQEEFNLGRRFTEEEQAARFVGPARPAPPAPTPPTTFDEFGDAVMAGTKFVETRNEAARQAEIEDAASEVRPIQTPAEEGGPGRFSKAIEDGQSVNDRFSIPSAPGEPDGSVGLPKIGNTPKIPGDIQGGVTSKNLAAQNVQRSIFEYMGIKDNPKFSPQEKEAARLRIPEVADAEARRLHGLPSRHSLEAQPPPPPIGPIVAQTQRPPFSDPERERMFMAKYHAIASEMGISQDPDNILHQYDYRSAFDAGQLDPQKAADGSLHLPSRFKLAKHPNRFVDGIDTITDLPTPVQGPRQEGVSGPLLGTESLGPVPPDPNSRGLRRQRSFDAIQQAGGLPPVNQQPSRMDQLIADGADGAFEGPRKPLRSVPFVDESGQPVSDIGKASADEARFSRLIQENNGQVNIQGLTPEGESFNTPAVPIQQRQDPIAQPGDNEQEAFAREDARIKTEKDMLGGVAENARRMFDGLSDSEKEEFNSSKRQLLLQGHIRVAFSVGEEERAQQLLRVATGKFGEFSSKEADSNIPLRPRFGNASLDPGEMMVANAIADFQLKRAKVKTRTLVKPAEFNIEEASMAALNLIIPGSSGPLANRTLLSQGGPSATSKPGERLPLIEAMGYKLALPTMHMGPSLIARMLKLGSPDERVGRFLPAAIQQIFGVPAAMTQEAQKFIFSKDTMEFLKDLGEGPMLVEQIMQESPAQTRGEAFALAAASVAGEGIGLFSPVAKLAPGIAMMKVVGRSKRLVGWTQWVRSRTAKGLFQFAGKSAKGFQGSITNLVGDTFHLGFGLPAYVLPEKIVEGFESDDPDIANLMISMAAESATFLWDAASVHVPSVLEGMAKVFTDESLTPAEIEAVGNHMTPLLLWGVPGVERSKVGRGVQKKLGQAAKDFVAGDEIAFDRFFADMRSTPGLEAEWMRNAKLLEQQLTEGLKAQGHNISAGVYNTIVEAGRAAQLKAASQGGGSGVSPAGGAPLTEGSASRAGQITKINKQIDNVEGQIRDITREPAEKPIEVDKPGEPLPTDRESLEKEQVILNDRIEQGKGEDPFTARVDEKGKALKPRPAEGIEDYTTLTTEELVASRPVTKGETAAKADAIKQRLSELGPEGDVRPPAEDLAPTSSGKEVLEVEIGGEKFTGDAAREKLDELKKKREEKIADIESQIAAEKSKGKEIKGKDGIILQKKGLFSSVKIRSLEEQLERAKTSTDDNFIKSKKPVIQSDLQAELTPEQKKIAGLPKAQPEFPSHLTSSGQRHLTRLRQRLNQLNENRATVISGLSPEGRGAQQLRKKSKNLATRISAATRGIIDSDIPALIIIRNGVEAKRAKLEAINEAKQSGDSFSSLYAQSSGHTAIAENLTAELKTGENSKTNRKLTGAEREKKLAQIESNLMKAKVKRERADSLLEEPTGRQRRESDLLADEITDRRSELNKLRSRIEKYIDALNLRLPKGTEGREIADKLAELETKGVDMRAQSDLLRKRAEDARESASGKKLKKPARAREQARATELDRSAAGLVREGLAVEEEIIRLRDQLDEVDPSAFVEQQRAFRDSLRDTVLQLETLGDKNIDTTEARLGLDKAESDISDLSQTNPSGLEALIQNKRILEQEIDLLQRNLALVNTRGRQTAAAGGLIPTPANLQAQRRRTPFGQGLVPEASKVADKRPFQKLFSKTTPVVKPPAIDIDDKVEADRRIAELRVEKAAHDAAAISAEKRSSGRTIEEVKKDQADEDAARSVGEAEDQRIAKARENFGDPIPVQGDEALPTKGRFAEDIDQRIERLKRAIAAEPADSRKSGKATLKLLKSGKLTPSRQERLLEKLRQAEQEKKFGGAKSKEAERDQVEYEDPFSDKIKKTLNDPREWSKNEDGSRDTTLRSSEKDFLGENADSLASYLEALGYKVEKTSSTLNLDNIGKPVGDITLDSHRKKELVSFMKDETNWSTEADGSKAIKLTSRKGEEQTFGGASVGSLTKYLEASGFKVARTTIEVEFTDSRGRPQKADAFDLVVETGSVISVTDTLDVAGPAPKSKESKDPAAFNRAESRRVSTEIRELERFIAGKGDRPFNKPEEAAIISEVVNKEPEERRPIPVGPPAIGGEDIANKIEETKKANDAIEARVVAQAIIETQNRNNLAAFRRNRNARAASKRRLFEAKAKNETVIELDPPAKGEGKVLSVQEVYESTLAEMKDVQSIIDDLNKFQPLTDENGIALTPRERQANADLQTAQFMKRRAELVGVMREIGRLPDGTIAPKAKKPKVIRGRNPKPGSGSNTIFQVLNKNEDPTRKKQKIINVDDRYVYNTNELTGGDIVSADAGIATVLWTLYGRNNVKSRDIKSEQPAITWRVHDIRSGLPEDMVFADADPTNAYIEFDTKKLAPGQIESIKPRLGDRTGARWVFSQKPNGIVRFELEPAASKHSSPDAFEADASRIRDAWEQFRYDMEGAQPNRAAIKRAEKPAKDKAVKDSEDLASTDIKLPDTPAIKKAKATLKATEGLSDEALKNVNAVTKNGNATTTAMNNAERTRNSVEDTKKSTAKKPIFQEDGFPSFDWVGKPVLDRDIKLNDIRGFHPRFEKGRKVNKRLREELSEDLEGVRRYRNTARKIKGKKLADLTTEQEKYVFLREEYRRAQELRNKSADNIEKELSKDIGKRQLKAGLITVESVGTIESPTDSRFAKYPKILRKVRNAARQLYRFRSDLKDAGVSLPPSIESGLESLRYLAEGGPRPPTGVTAKRIREAAKESLLWATKDATVLGGHKDDLSQFPEKYRVDGLLSSLSSGPFSVQKLVSNTLGAREWRVGLGKGLRELKRQLSGAFAKESDAASLERKKRADEAGGEADDFNIDALDAVPSEKEVDTELRKKLGDRLERPLSVDTVRDAIGIYDDLSSVVEANNRLSSVPEAKQPSPADVKLAESAKTVYSKAIDQLISRLVNEGEVGAKALQSEWENTVKNSEGVLTDGKSKLDKGVDTTGGKGKVGSDAEVVGDGAARTGKSGDRGEVSGASGASAGKKDGGVEPGGDATASGERTGRGSSGGDIAGGRDGSVSGADKSDRSGSAATDKGGPDKAADKQSKAGAGDREPKSGRVDSKRPELTNDDVNSLITDGEVLDAADRAPKLSDAEAKELLGDIFDGDAPLGSPAKGGGKPAKVRPPRKKKVSLAPRGVPPVEAPRDSTPEQKAKHAFIRLGNKTLQKNNWRIVEASQDTLVKLGKLTKLLADGRISDEVYTNKANQWINSGLIERGQLVKAPKRVVKPEKVSETHVRVAHQSQGPPANMLLPTNLAAAMTDALRELQRDTGKQIDDYVREKLKFKTNNDMFDVLNAAQIENVALAIGQIEKGKGFIAGSETGVGKGRMGVGMAESARLAGKPVVMITDKPNLFTDWYRDLLAMGLEKNWDIGVVNHGAPVYHPSLRDAAGTKEIILRGADSTEAGIKMLEDFAAGKSKHNVIWMTYSQIQAGKFLTVDEIREGKTLPAAEGADRTARRRMAALQALAKSRNSMFVLDESHKATGTDSNTNKFFAPLLEDASGVGYLSATFAKRAESLPLYAQTDILNAFGGKAKDAVEALQHGGDALLELMTNMLTRGGQHARFDKSYEGISFKDTLDETAMDRNVKISDAVNKVFRSIYAFDAEKNVTSDPKKKGPFSEARDSIIDDMDSRGIPQNSRTVPMPLSFSQLAASAADGVLVSLKADSIANQAIADIKAGRKPMIFMNFTGASQLKKFGGLTGMAADQYGYQSVLRSWIDRSRIIQWKEYGVTKQEVVSEDISLEAWAHARDARDAVNGLMDVLAGVELADRESSTKTAGKATKEILGLREERDKLVNFVKGSRKGELGPAEDFTKGDRDKLSAVQKKIDAAEKKAGITERIDRENEEITGQATGQFTGQQLARMGRFLPPSPIDWIRFRLEEAGFSMGELTGRDHRIEIKRDQKTGAIISKFGNIETLDRNKLIDQFNSHPEEGGIHSILMNSAGAVGASMHAAPEFSDQRQRVFHFLTLSDDVAVNVQAAGRPNRLGQVSLPTYFQWRTGLPMDERRVVNNNTKMKSLGASTTGKVKLALKSAGGAGFGADIFNSYGDQVVREWAADPRNDAVVKSLGFFDELGGNKLQSILTGSDVAKRVTGKVMFLPHVQQVQFWNSIRDAYDSRIERINAADANVLAMVSRDLKVKTSGYSVVFSGNRGKTGPFDQPTYLERVKITLEGKPHTIDDIDALVKGAADDAASGKVGHREEAGRYLKKLLDIGKTEVKEKPGHIRSLSTGNRISEAQAETASRRAVNLARIGLSNLKVGESYKFSELSDGNNDGLFGILIDVEVSRRAKAPGPTINDLLGFTESQIKLVFAVNTVGKTMKVPLDKLAITATRTDLSSGEKTRLFEQNFQGDQNGVVTEDRYIITGNVPGGFNFIGRARPQLVNFTRADGNTRAGALMARTWRPKRMFEGGVPLTVDEATRYWNKSTEVNQDGPHQLLVLGNSVLRSEAQPPITFEGEKKPTKFGRVVFQTDVGTEPYSYIAQNPSIFNDLLSFVSPKGDSFFHSRIDSKTQSRSFITIQEGKVGKFIDIMGKRFGWRSLATKEFGLKGEESMSLALKVSGKTDPSIMKPARGEEIKGGPTQRFEGLEPLPKAAQSKEGRPVKQRQGKGGPQGQPGGRFFEAISGKKPRGKSQQPRALFKRGQEPARELTEEQRAAPTPSRSPFYSTGPRVTVTGGKTAFEVVANEKGLEVEVNDRQLKAVPKNRLKWLKTTEGVDGVKVLARDPNGGVLVDVDPEYRPVKSILDRKNTEAQDIAAENADRVGRPNNEDRTDIPRASPPLEGDGSPEGKKGRLGPNIVEQEIQKLLQANMEPRKGGGRLVTRRSMSKHALIEFVIENSRRLNLGKTGLALRIGGWKGFRKAAGVFFPSTGGVRTLQWDDFNVFVHEMGHYLDDVIFKEKFGKTFDESISFAGQQELNWLGRDLYGSVKTAYPIEWEGTAQLVLAEIMTNEAHNIAPEAHKFLMKWLKDSKIAKDKDLGKYFAELKLMASEYIEQGAIKRGMSQIVFSNDKEFRRDPIRINRIKSKYWEPGATLYELQRDLNRNDIELAEKDKPYEVFRATQRRAPAILKFAITDEIRDLSGQNVVGPGFEAAVRPYLGEKSMSFLERIRPGGQGEKWSRLSLFTVARHALDLQLLTEGGVKAARKWDPNAGPKDTKGNPQGAWKEGKRIETGLSDIDAQYIVAKLAQEPGLVEAADNILRWQRDILKVWGVEAGLITKKDYDRLIERFPHYVPLRRVFDKDVNPLAADIQNFRRSGGLGEGGFFHRLGGSFARVKDTLDQMLTQTNDMISAGQKQRVKLAIERLIPKFGKELEDIQRPNFSKGEKGFATWFELLDTPVHPEKLRLQEIEKQLKDAGITFGPEVNLMTQLEVWRKHKPSEPLHNVFEIRDPSGKTRFYSLRADLWEMFKGMDSHQMNWALEWSFGLAARLTRLGATQLNPKFGLATNPFRDIIGAALRSKSSSVAMPKAMAESVIGIMQETFRKTPGLKKLAGSAFTEQAQVWSALGGEIGAGPWAVDSAQFRNVRREVQRRAKLGNTVAAVVHPLDILRTINSMSEGGVRIKEFQRSMKVAKQMYPGDEISQSIKASRDAADVTLDFLNYGTSIAWLNRVSAFSGAHMQGLFQVVRSFSGDNAPGTKVMLAKGMQMAVAAGVLFNYSKDKKWYKDQSPWEWMHYWNIPMGWAGLYKDDGSEVVFALPKSGVLGLAFGTMAEWGLRGAYYDENTLPRTEHEKAEEVRTAIRGIQDPFGLTNFATEVASGTGLVRAIGKSPLALFDLARPILEIVSNELVYYNTPLNPKKGQNILPELQYTPHTLEFYKYVSRKWGQFVSPDPQKTGNEFTEKLKGLSVFHSDYWNPITIQHLIGGYTAQLPTKVLRMMETLGVAPWVPEDWPGRGQFSFWDSLGLPVHKYRLLTGAKEASDMNLDHTEAILNAFNTQYRSGDRLPVRELQSKAKRLSPEAYKRAMTLTPVERRLVLLGVLENHKLWGQVMRKAMYGTGLDKVTGEKQWPGLVNMMNDEQDPVKKRRMMEIINYQLRRATNPQVIKLFTGLMNDFKEYPVSSFRDVIKETIDQMRKNVATPKKKGRKKNE